MAADERLICNSADLEEGGRGVRFEVMLGGERLPAFVVRHGGRVRGYLNRCGHIPVELDYRPGEFFEPDQLYLICSTHGARYDPASGACVTGRCNGRGLTPLAVEERPPGIYLKEDL
jgi:nitrite reductase/ring-hydroxylating ferredoxin subunit